MALSSPAMIHGFMALVFLIVRQNIINDGKYSTIKFALVTMHVRHACME
jgi:hypothetical protein